MEIASARNAVSLGRADFLARARNIARRCQLVKGNRQLRKGTLVLYGEWGDTREADLMGNTTSIYPRSAVGSCVRDAVTVRPSNCYVGIECEWK